MKIYNKNQVYRLHVKIRFTRSHAPRGNAVQDALRPVYARRWSRFEAQRALTAFPRSPWERGKN